MNHQSLTAAAAQLLERSNLVLSRWAAHRMAVKMSGGGRDSLQKMQQIDHLLFNLLSELKEQVYIDDGEDVVNELMLPLNTEIGDYNIGEFSLPTHSEKALSVHQSYANHGWREKKQDAKINGWKSPIRGKSFKQAR